MLFGEYRFTATFESDAILPPFKGSTFRGAFGIALKKVVCALKLQQCHSCILQSRCLYSRLFETTKVSSGNESASSIHPFVIEPTPNTRTEFRKGNLFEFNLLLFGKTNLDLPYFVYAFKEMGKIGTGRAINGKRGEFSLKTVHQGNLLIYSDDDDKLLVNPPSEIDFDAISLLDSEWNEITIELQTPLRIKFRNEFAANLPFHLLVRAALRRIADLNAHFGYGEPKLDYPGLVSRAKDITTLDSSVKWVDWRRYSNRQEQAMFFGGLQGRATYTGNLTEFLPLLRYAEKVHLGKATTFGLGKISIVSYK